MSCVKATSDDNASLRLTAYAAHNAVLLAWTWCGTAPPADLLGFALDRAIGGRTTALRGGERLFADGSKPHHALLQCWHWCVAPTNVAGGRRRCRHTNVALRPTAQVGLYRSQQHRNVCVHAACDLR